MKGISEVERISTNSVAVTMPLNIMICVAPFLEMPAHMWTFGRCDTLVYTEHSSSGRILFCGFICEDNIMKLLFVI